MHPMSFQHNHYRKLIVKGVRWLDVILADVQIH